jgi:sporulation protein YlmC with PRC-barrel domain
MARREVQVELLLSRRVLALNGRPVGRLEEIQAELRGGACYVTEFHVGAYALFERLAASSIGRELLKLIGVNRKGGGYRVPWDKLDLRDPARPRLLCEVKELKPLEEED